MDQERPPAVIVGLASTVGLQTARLLADRGVRVIGLAGDARHFAARTRAVDRVIETDVHSEAFLPVLEHLGRELGGTSVLVPCTDQAVLVASLHRGRLADHFSLPLAGHDVVRSLTDKAEFAGLASRLGLPVPATHVLTCRADGIGAAAALRFPVVVKPSVKCSHWKRVTAAKVVRVDDPGTLVRMADELCGAGLTLVAQEYVAGGDDRLFTCNGYFGPDGEPVVTFTTRKVRQWPPYLGIASYAVECPDDEVTRATADLFRAVGFRGLGYVEMKRDDVGRLRVIEANVGRPTGRSATAEAAGVELLATMYADAAGLPRPVPPTARAATSGSEVAWIDLRRDAMAAWHYWRRGELTLRDWVGDLRGPKAHAVYSRRDPLPFALEITQSARKVARRRQGHRRRPVPAPGPRPDPQPIPGARRAG